MTIYTSTEKRMLAEGSAPFLRNTDGHIYPGETKLAHEPYPRCEYDAGESCPFLPPYARAEVPFTSSQSSRKARHRFTASRNCGICPRMLLASSSRLC